ncbi:aldehyde dehydrogenase [Salmonella enterica subsp. enterica]|uniref:Aldehyde dehydrogenase n=1 Tax=Salmonella enterica I TaxID=59201 RepID=A0A3S5DMR8_SALET|nr:aldehyde dehydrogenase [Salmonella enterica subsp. enterica]
MHSQNVSRLNLAARTLQTSIFVKNGPSYAGIGVGGEGFTTFTIATPNRWKGPRQRVLFARFPALRTDQRLFYSLTEVAMNTFSLQTRFVQRSGQPWRCSSAFTNKHIWIICDGFLAHSPLLDTPA